MSIIKPLARQAAQLVPSYLLRPLGRPAVLYFHGVESTLSGRELERIHHQADIFEQIAAILKRTFDVLPMSAIDEVLRNPQQHGRAVFITFDDGYANNTLAADILERLGLPWTLFVSTHHIDTGETDPVFLARLFFMHAPRGIYNLPNFAFRTMLKSLGQRKRAMERGVAALKALDAQRAGQTLAAMKEYLGHAELTRLITEAHAKAFLSWDQIRTLHARNVEIGSHAVIYWPLHGDQSGDYLRQQAIVSKARIEAEVGSCRYFAYPFGRRADCASAAWNAVRDAGYSHAFTAIPGTLDASRNPWLLPRYGVGIRETALAPMIPMLRANNWRFRQWQEAADLGQD